jgi:hypothetical protein
MKTLALIVLGCSLLAVPLRAHVGSPNVFFAGNAGPDAVRVVIRPPPTLPGIAQVDVRVEGEGVTGVSLQAAPWDSGDEAAPPPVRAMPMVGDAGLFSAPLWLLGRGSYRVRVAIESPRGHGTVSVPLNSAATQRPVMPPALGAALVAMGAALFAGAVGLAHAAAREATLAPGATPSFLDQRRARRVAIVTALLLAAAVAGGTLRWRAMDREFRNNALARPLPVEATIRTAGTLRLLRLTPGADASPTAGWDTLVTDHGKLMHLFLCREPDFTAFAHLHPVRRDAGTFENVLPPLPAGTYQLYAEVTQENGLSQTLVARLALPEPTGPALPPMADWKMVNEVWCQSPTVPIENAGQPFAWHISPAPGFTDTRTQVRPLMGGSRMVFHNAGELVENRETALRFTVFTADGHKAALQPYMGMLGHAVVRRADGAVFTHLHPAGTVSMGAQELLAQRDRGEEKPRAMLVVTGDEVAFPYAFPRPGDYRVWTQVRIAGRVLTGDFTVRVKPAP